MNNISNWLIIEIAIANMQRKANKKDIGASERYICLLEVQKELGYDEPDTIRPITRME